MEFFQYILNMTAIKRGNTYDEFLFNLQYDFPWLTVDQRETIVRLMRRLEPTKVLVTDDCYIVDLWELKKTTVELIARRIRRYLAESEELRRLGWQQSSSSSTPLVPLLTSSSSLASASHETSATQLPPVPKLVLRRHPSAGKSIYSCRIKDEGLKEKPAASTKRKAEDEEKFPVKRPRITSDPRLKRIFGRKAPTNICHKKDADERLKESVRRAKLEMEKRGR